MAAATGSIAASDVIMSERHRKNPAVLSTDNAHGRRLPTVLQLPARTRSVCRRCCSYTRTDWLSSCAILSGRVAAAHSEEPSPVISVEDGGGDDNGDGGDRDRKQQLVPSSAKLIPMNGNNLPRPLTITDLGPVATHGFPLRVAYQGVPGAYSEAAAGKAYPDCEAIPCDQFEVAFEAVELWIADRAVLPVENSLGGSIHRNYDLLIRHRLHIVGEVQLSVRHCLLALPGVKKEELRRVISHPQALSQCEHTLTNELGLSAGVAREAVDDTAGAAEYVAQNGLRDTAAIASARAAELYGMNILAEGIQDDSGNVTRFVMLAREPIIPKTDRPFKTSIVFAHDKAGTSVLFKVLSSFAFRDIKLTKIESRPHRNRPIRVVDSVNDDGEVNLGTAKHFEYIFYIDFEASMAEVRAQNALSEIQEFTSGPNRNPATQVTDAAVEMATSTIVFVGGKGAILSPDHIYAVSRGLATVQVDESALEKLSSNTASSHTTPIASSATPTRFIRREESRSALLVVLNKLVHSDSRGVRSAIPVLIVDALNRNCEAERLDFGSVSGFITSLYGLNGKEEPAAATKDEEFVIDNSFGVSNAVCGILDCVSSSLVVLLDAVSALSCEAARVDISAFDLCVSGDGFSVKNETDVAGDMKMLLFGSKLVGQVQSRYVTEIPTVNGNMREAVRLLHSRSRIELNSVIKTRKMPGSVGSGKENALTPLLVYLGSAVSCAGESCLGRIKLNLGLVSDADLKLKMLLAIQNGCCANNFGISTGDGVNTTNGTINLDALFDSFRDGFKLVSTNDSLQSVYDMLVKLQEVLAWEAVIALFVIEMDVSIEKPQSSLEGNSGNVKGERKNERKKKKTLGKGTSIVRQMLRDSFAIENGNLDVAVLTCWAQELSSFFDPMDARLRALFDKIKEIVQSNEVRRLPKIPKGTRDFGKEQMAIRERAFSVILGIFKRHGAVGLDTPVFELRETLMGKYGEDSKLIYDLADQGGEICSLRYDLTVPFARYLAMNNITSLKRYQIAKVYRRDNPSKGRYREFYQCDFDIAGQQGKMEPDFEVLKVLTELLDELEIGDYEIKFNHRKLLDGMLEICGVPSEKFRTVCSSIDKLDKQSFDQVKKELVDEKGLTIEVAEKIGSFVKKRGLAFDILSDLTGEGSLFSHNKGSILALEELGVLFNALNKAKSLDKVVFDLSLARGLDYYTGVIFEVVMKGSNQVGSIAAGGRYDNLVGMFSGKQVPAVGISLGIERVFTIMESNHQAGNQEIRSTETQVLVAVLGLDLTVAAELVAEMWNVKIPAEFGVHKNVMKHIKRAVDGGIPWMVIIGESEQAQGIVKLKDIKANKEETFNRDQIVVELQTRLNSSSFCRYTIV